MELIAHRGACSQYPENSIAAFDAALRAGARLIELDVQLTRDLEPFVHHDRNLSRMTGVLGEITQSHSKDLRGLRASYPDRFGDRYLDNPLSSLREFSDWFLDHDDATAFVEIKRHSIRSFGVARTAEAVLHATDEIHDQIVVISFDAEVLYEVRSLAPALPTGLVLAAYDAASEEIVCELRPQYVLCKTRLLPAAGLPWDGDWRWVPYCVDSVEEVVEYAARGFDLLETNCIVEILGHPAWSSLHE